jgi:hypothetical protein
MGHALVLGDFKSTPGKRTYAIAIPQTDSSNPNGVLVETKWLEFTDDAKTKVDDYVTANGQYATMTPEKLAEFLALIQKMPGVDVLATPRILTASGMAGSVSITESRDTPAGPIIVGPQVDLTPTALGDGTVHLAIEAKLNQAQGLDEPKKAE